MEEDLGTHIIKTLNLEEDAYTYQHRKIGYDFYFSTAKIIEETKLQKIIESYYENKKMFRLKNLKYFNHEETETVRITKKSENHYELKITKLKNILN